MKLLTFLEDKTPILGIKTEKGVINLLEAAKYFNLSIPLTMSEAIEGGEEALSLLKKIADDCEKEGVIQSEESLVYGPCVINPEKILCVGINYKKHALETNTPFPSSPIIFSKFNNALSGHKNVITLPASAKSFDYEAELVIVMGKTANNVKEEEALSYVFGYANGNDFSARDVQFSSSQWLLGKTCDGFAPLGPWIVTKDEVTDPDNLTIECFVNGEERQSSNTKDMIFNCSQIISHLSRFMTLKPGDIIFTGTPSGVILGYPEADQVWLKAGDKVSVKIEKLGTLENELK
ncbi:fumarylacetoacetate hydrolase family protein [Desulfosporosinus sp. PR]|uniref:fumarylacetoacetate hydrolase family protein n=1 Tax=Candidatus Desulfosporosinus nitrosoreducens TaxID=3401928 RepID=UPI0027E6D759|nr:fumarylacetoacetate hydrolase family protein [Desulfosporosinus sp. PR]MDQ7094374.1 fumarylacetoacetate hydrolase family protein [Desulfosporosinus sp. PR]